MRHEWEEDLMNMEKKFYNGGTFTEEDRLFIKQSHPYSSSIKWKFDLIISSVLEWKDFTQKEQNRMALSKYFPDFLEEVLSKHENLVEDALDFLNDERILSTHMDRFIVKLDSLKEKFYSENSMSDAEIWFLYLTIQLVEDIDWKIELFKSELILLHRFTKSEQLDLVKSKPFLEFLELSFNQNDSETLNGIHMSLTDTSLVKELEEKILEIATTKKPDFINW